MFDEFSLFESTSFDDLMNDSYATESYDLFDDSYGYAFEADEAEDNEGEKKKSGIFEAIKGIIKKFIDAVHQFLLTVKNFLFGASREKTGKDGKKFSQKVIPNLFAFIKELAKKSKESAVRKVTKASNSGFLALEAASAADELAEKQAAQKYNATAAKNKLATAYSIDNPGIGGYGGASEIGYGVEEVIDGFKKEIAKIEKEDADDPVAKCYANYLKSLINEVGEAKKWGKTPGFASNTSSSNTSSKTENTAETGASSKIEKAAETTSNQLTNEVKSAGASAAKEGTTTALQKFKIFVHSIGFFFKYFARGIRNAWVASGVLMRAKAAAKSAKSKKESGFLGRIAEESYNEGYQAALREHGYSHVEESYDDLFADDYAYESYDSSDEYMRGYYAALADFS